ncbi:hypothetical protein SEA_WATERT_14 [Microbacterium phage WaterT]|nr:hypothetical protein SEA_WATERT_14 [Microbacterium phage WaterT]
MAEIRVGDRVVHNSEGDKGTVTRLADYKIWVSWDEARGAETGVTGNEIDLVESFEDTVQEYSSFEQSVNRITGDIAKLLIEKNKAYGDSALNPVRVFSKASRIEQLNVRIDDKISRIQRGTDYEDEDTVKDLIGYLVLRLIAEESE